MFTGIISHLGKFTGFRAGKTELLVEVSADLPLQTGDSLAVNGVCLSLIRRERPSFVFNLSTETLQKTNFRFLKRGDLLNLELPLTLSTPLGGHLVTGHIDTTEKVLDLRKKPAGWRLSVSLKSEFRPYFISKGSVAVNGVSLTVAELGSASFDMELIPITMSQSNLGGLRRGDTVNVESDMIGKYVYNWISEFKKS
jgi:riboflavin synthase